MILLYKVIVRGAKSQITVLILTLPPLNSLIKSFIKHGRLVALQEAGRFCIHTSKQEVQADISAALSGPHGHAYIRALTNTR